jgi:diaminopimelate epimerase
MKFVKVEALGNDFILVEAATLGGDTAAAVRALCDRRRGVGADGVLLVSPGGAGDASGAPVDARVAIWNADGSEAEISGNGLRCAARWLLDCGRAQSPLAIATRAGVTRVTLANSGTGAGDGAGALRVSLGEPRWRPSDVPIAAPGERFVEAKLEGVPLPVTALSMGNPHAVLFVDGALPASRWGPVIESHPAFPERTNVEFVRVVARDRLVVLFWERGVGPTASSGTGAAAAFAAAVATGRADRRARIEMEGGALDAGWDETGVWTEGPARVVFQGEWEA